MAIKLIALNTDGTLLNSQGAIQESSKEVIKKALNRGLKIVLCSSNSINSLKPYMEELGIRGSAQYVITMDGAIVRNADDDVFSENLIPNSFYRKLTAFGMENNIPFNIVDSEARIITADHNVDPMIYQQAYENQDFLYIRLPDQIPEEEIRIAKGCFVGKKTQLNQIEEKVRKTFGKDLYVVRVNDRFLELLSPDVNKGQALAQLCDRLGISQMETMAIGNAENDINMFKFAGTAICMENGSEKAKKGANYITASNNEDGISQAFTKFIF